MCDSPYWYEWIPIYRLHPYYSQLAKRRERILADRARSESMVHPIEVAKDGDQYHVINGQAIVQAYAMYAESENALLYCKVYDRETLGFVKEDAILPIAKLRNERRRATQIKLLKRKRLMRQLGLQGGYVYARHREKITLSTGYMRTGNVSHYVSTYPRRKTRSRDQYGSVYTPPKRDIVRIDQMNQQESDDKE